MRVLLRSCAHGAVMCLPHLTLQFFSRNGCGHLGLQKPLKVKVLLLDRFTGACRLAASSSRPGAIHRFSDWYPGLLLARSASTAAAASTSSRFGGEDRFHFRVELGLGLNCGRAVACQGPGAFL